MKQTDTYAKPQQVAFHAFLVLFSMLIILSSCGTWLLNFSVLQISLIISVALVLVSLVLWLFLRYRLRAQQASYLAIYQFQIKEKSHFLLGPNGSLTTREGKPLSHKDSPVFRPKAKKTRS